MASDLETEVQAIDSTLLECSAEEVALVRKARRRAADVAWRGEGKGGRGRMGDKSGWGGARVKSWGKSGGN